MPETIAELISLPGGSNFYEELKLVYSIYRFEQAEFGEWQKRPVNRGTPLEFARKFGVYFAYTLLLAIDDGDARPLMKSIRTFDPTLDGFVDLMHSLIDHCGSTFWRRVPFAIGLVPKYSFRDHIKGKIRNVTDASDIRRALQWELRVCPREPITALAAHIRAPYNQDCRRFGKSVAMAAELLERRDGLSHSIPDFDAENPHAVFYPR